jgi:hypothetical protein
MTKAVQLTLTGLLLALVVPSMAVAIVMFSIDDRTETLSLGGTSPFGFDPTTLSTQFFNVGVEGVDIHGEYVSILPLAPGTTAFANFNFFEQTANTISDNLDITFTGHTPTSTDPNNISVDLHFRSDADGGVGLPALPVAVNLTETGDFQNLTGLIVNLTRLPDFHISVASDVEAVPEPATCVSLLTGLGMMWGTSHRRKRRASNRPLSA